LEAKYPWGKLLYTGRLAAAKLQLTQQSRKGTRGAGACEKVEGLKIVQKNWGLGGGNDEGRLGQT